MNYQMVSLENAGKELNKLHRNIETNLRQTVQDAVRAGDILTKVKIRLSHGDFLPWIKANCSFSQQSASNYMRLFHHHDKLPSVGNLQEAYRQIETIERQEKQTEQQRAYNRVVEFRKTGIKPEGWRRGTDDKLLQEEIDRDERVKEAKQKMDEAGKRRKKERAEREREREERKQEREAMSWAFDGLVKDNLERQSFKQKIKLSQQGENEPFIDALMDYLDELQDDNRRIEACNNIIKVARNIAAQLHHKGATA